MRLAAPLLLLACLAGASVQAVQPPAWATEIAALLGTDTAPASGAADPNGIYVTRRAEQPAGGVVVKGAHPSHASPHAYVWTGPVAAGDGMPGMMKKYPMLALGLQTAAFLKLVKYAQTHRPPSPPGPSPSPSPGPSPSPSPSPSPPPPPPPVPEFYVQVVDGQFISGVPDGDSEGLCRYLYPAGLNKAELVEAGAGAPRLFDAQLTEPGLTGPASLRRLLDQAVETGLSLLRINAFARDAEYSVADQPGGRDTPVVYNEGVLRGLDYVLAQAQERGIRVLMVLTDYFSDQAGGPLQYLSFAGDDTTCGGDWQPTCDAVKAAFYTNPEAIRLYQQYAALLIERVNTVNGRTYKDDPTIWGWDLMNEPRCTLPECTDAAGTNVIDTWVAQQAAFVKGLDSTHLVTVGLDGFYQRGPGLATNPYGGAEALGTDFVSTNLAAGVDFAEFNVYPENWGVDPADWQTFVPTWISRHSEDARTALQKPALVKELGAAPTERRDEFYQLALNSAFGAIQTDRDAVGGLKGALYWQGWVEGTTAVWWTLDPAGRWGILTTDPAYARIADFSLAANALGAQPFPCPADRPLLKPVFQQPLDCPEGFEGPECDIDVNECVRGTDDCGANAACVNTAGGYTCQCHLTYVGDGRTCVEVPGARAAVEDLFFTDNKLNNFGGSVDVAYPVTAPGYAYDPTGYFAPSISRLNVTATDCMIACQTAGETACTSFFYNIAAESCILRANECPFNQKDPEPPFKCKYPIYEPNRALPVPGLQGEQVCGFGVTYYRKNYALPNGCAAST